jgi:hypothetical protein
LKVGLANRVQLTTDGHKAYLTAVEDAFGSDIDYAQWQKIYGTEQPQGEVRYSPAQCMAAIWGRNVAYVLNIQHSRRAAAERQSENCKRYQNQPPSTR